MSGELDDKRALVTGAGTGIGRVIARRLADAGAGVALAGRNVGDLKETLAGMAGDPRRHLVVQVDLTEPDSVTNLADTVQQRWGPLDVLVSNSGVAGPSAPLWEVDLADWQHTISVNLTGAYLVCRAFLPGMTRRGSGSVVLVGSMTGKRPLLHRSPYCASKMGLVGLCRALALDAGPYGVRVNLVSPGFVEGPRMDWVIARQMEARGLSEADVRDEMTSDAPLHRFVSPEEVAEATLFLASEKGSGITGADLNISAGLTMY